MNANSKKKTQTNKQTTTVSLECSVLFITYFTSGYISDTLDTWIPRKQYSDCRHQCQAGQEFTQATVSLSHPF